MVWVHCYVSMVCYVLFGVHARGVRVVRVDRTCKRGGLAGVLPQHPMFSTWEHAENTICAL